ncbi:MAG TPA: hypothetical protein VNH18_04590 [Bryobacteraceae bacterium]|nr:hypothetical protein [Bryobacteraceae bacterium]
MKLNGVVSNGSSGSSTGAWASGVLWLVFLCGYWCISAAVLWWAYDLSSLVRGGFYIRGEAVLLVTKMGLIVTVLAGVIWFLQGRKTQESRSWRRGWAVFWKTVLVCLGYAGLVIMRRQLWQPSQGISDSAMFWPLVGHVNSQFFSEFKWVSFVAVVVPIIGWISAMLFLLRVQVISFTQPHH